MALISVIVPVYNVEPYIHRCVDSILRQTFEDFTLILVDDGSPDNCGVICDAYAGQDNRVRVIHQQNAGLSAARNAAIDWMFANSDSQWLTFIDSDDWVHPEFLERMLDAATTQEAWISVCGYAETGGDAPEIPPESLKPECWSPGEFYRKRVANATIACAKLYHRSCFEQIRYPVGKIHEDEFVTYCLLFRYPRLVYIPAPLYAYYINSAGITKRAWSPKRLNAWEAFEQQIVFFENMGDQELAGIRTRSFLENALMQLSEAEASPNAAELTAEIQKIKKRIRRLIRQCWKRDKILFWPDFDVLVRFYPILTKAYRLWLELSDQ